MWGPLVAGLLHGGVEERLLDQVQKRAYNPPSFGVVRVAYPKVWFPTSTPL